MSLERQWTTGDGVVTRVSENGEVIFEDDCGYKVVMLLDDLAAFLRDNGYNVTKEA